jgi:threonine dehydratase
MTTLQPAIVASAAKNLAGIANRTPVMISRTLDERVGGQIFLKCENFQRVGAFKFRGAYYAISQLSDKRRAAGVITHSSGNHAQGVALAAQILGVQATVVMPEDAPSIKREATEGYGAKIVPCAAINREEITEQLISDHGFTLIHPYDDDNIIAGQGTSAWELFDEVGELDLLFVPVGGGGLISGCALASAARSPKCQVIGVEPESAADANRSWREDRVITLEAVPDTIADGLRPRHIGRRNLDIMRRYVADMTTVSEREIVESLLYIWQCLKIVVETSAAVALAPLLSGRFEARGRRIGIILSGGNVDLKELWYHRYPRTS